MEVLADGSTNGDEEKIHEQLTCLLSVWSEWHLTVARQPEEQNRGRTGKGIAHFGREGFRALLQHSVM